MPQVLLLHANEVGAAQWDALFTWLEGRGYRFAGADEVLADPAFTAPHRFVAGPGGSLWYRLRRERGSEKAREPVTALLARAGGGVEPRRPRGVLRGLRRRRRVRLPERAHPRPAGRPRPLPGALPDAAAMGTLTLEPLDVREAWGAEASVLGDALPSRTHGISVAARWTLLKADGSSATGLTLIVLTAAPAGWVIVHDASM